MNGWLAFALFVVAPNVLLALWTFGPDLLYVWAQGGSPVIPTNGTPKLRARRIGRLGPRP